MNKPSSILPVVGLGLVIGLNVYFRSFPVNFPQLAGDARTRVEARLVQRSEELINRNYSNLSSMARQSLVKVAVEEYSRQNKDAIARDVRDEFARLKDRFQDKEGQTYLFELDCWHWARYVENTVRTGHPGDAVVNGQEWDLLMNHPAGSKVSYNMLLYYVSAFLYKTTTVFARIPLHTFLFYLPLAFITVFLTALYLICWRFYGAIAAVMCSLFVGLAPLFIPRSCAGWFDMDILNMLFPLLVVFSYLMAYSRLKPAVRLMWIALSAVLVGLFAYVWSFWAFIVLVIILYEVYSILDLLSERLQYKTVIRAGLLRHAGSLGVFLPLSALAVYAICGIEPLSVLTLQVLNAVTLNDPINASIWPNVLSTVGELSRPSFSQIANHVGSSFVFLITLCCMLVLVLRNKRYRGLKRESIFLLVLWFVTIFAICYKGTRLIVFLLIPMGIFLGWGIREAFNYCMRRRRKKKFLLPVWGICCCILIGTFWSNGRKMAVGLYPMIDDSWYMLLTNIRQNTPADTVMNSWWDFGDWFKAIAGRRVIFDGQSQNTPQGYWMAKAFLAQSEQEAIAILRMLNNGGNRAFEEIEAQIKDPFRSLLLLERALTMSRDEARQLLTQHLPSQTASRVLSLLYDIPRRALFVVDYTLQGKMYPISYLGNWDPVRLYIVKKMNTASKDDILAYLASLGIDEKVAATLYSDARLLLPSQYNDWISHHARFLSGAIPGKRQGDIVLFDNGLVYNIKDGTVFAFSGYDGKYRIPKSMFYVENDRLAERVFPDASLGFSVLLLQDGDTYRIVECERELGTSLFTQLYFLKAKGLRFFKPFTDNADPQNYVGVFEINWTGDER